MAITERTTAGHPGAAGSMRDLPGRGRKAVDPALRAAVGTLPESTRLIAGYHFGWSDEHGRPTTAPGGKAIRPVLTLLAAEAVGGAFEPALPAAVAVELAHAFSLLHDDVMDGDLTRRYRPTAWSVFGVGAAILAGDSLLTLAFETLAASDRPVAGEATRRLGAAVQQLVEGQCADLAFERRADVGRAECLRMAKRKTGALLGCACGLGALFGGGTPEQAGRLQTFGERLGVAFQLVDDLLGIWGDPERTGKPVHADLRCRKKSLPVVAALTSGTTAACELARLYHRKRPLTEADIVRVAELVEAAGGRDWCQNQIDEQLEQALHHLRSAGANGEGAAGLADLAHLITDRDH